MPCFAHCGAARLPVTPPVTPPLPAASWETCGNRTIVQPHGVELKRSRETLTRHHEHRRTAQEAARAEQAARDARVAEEAERLTAAASEAGVAEIKLRAITRIGEISAELETGKGNGRGQVLPSGGKYKAATLKAAGISTSSAQRADQLGGLVAGLTSRNVRNSFRTFRWSPTRFTLPRLRLEVREDVEPYPYRFAALARSPAPAHQRRGIGLRVATALPLRLEG